MDSGPEIHAHHRHKPMRHWVDMAMGASAIIISIVSLFLALEDGNAMKQLVQANSWPYVAPEFSTQTEDGAARFKMYLINKGVGPAKVETLEVFFDGKPQLGPRHLIAAMIGPDGMNHAHKLATSDIVGSVLSTRETVDFLSAMPETFAPEQNEQMRAAVSKLDIRVCYCSVFDECWLIGGPGASAKPKLVKVCERPKVPYENGSLDLASGS